MMDFECSKEGCGGNVIKNLTLFACCKRWDFGISL